MIERRRRRLIKDDLILDMLISPQIPPVIDLCVFIANALTNSLSKALFDKFGSRRIKLVIDQRLHLFYKLHCVRLADMIIKRDLIYPARVDIEESLIPNRVERINAHTTRFPSCRCNDLA